MLEHTYCPECKNIAIKRFGFDIESWNLNEKNQCKFCGNQILEGIKKSESLNIVVLIQLIIDFTI